MSRQRNTTSSGSLFDDATIRDVWAKGHTSEHTGYKQDICGDYMKFDLYGERREYGWEIDHINPVSNGGSDGLSNLQALYWENNVAKSDTYPWRCEK